MPARGRCFVCAAKDLKPRMVIDGPTGALRVLAVAPLDGGLEVRGLTAESPRPYRFMTSPEDGYRAREDDGVDAVRSRVALSLTGLPPVVASTPGGTSAAKLVADAVKVVETEVVRRQRDMDMIRNGRQS